MSEPEPSTQPLAAALVTEATRKAGLVWLDYAGAEGARPAWHIWYEGAAYVVTGPGEQHLPGLPEATTVQVLVPSKDSRARVVAWTAAPAAITPADTDWQPAVTALAASRLNAPDAPTLVQRWAQTATVVRLAPTGEVSESPGEMTDGSHARAPRETETTTLTRRPWMLGGNRVGTKRRPPDASAH